MTPTTLPPAMAVAMAEERGRRLAAVHRAHSLLQYAAVGCLDEDQAVAHAVRLLRGPRPAAPPRVWVGHRREGSTEWLELPGVQSVRWA